MFLNLNDPSEVGIVLLEIILLIDDYLGCHSIHHVHIQFCVI